MATTFSCRYPCGFLVLFSYYGILIMTTSEFQALLLQVATYSTNKAIRSRSLNDSLVRISPGISYLNCNLSIFWWMAIHSISRPYPTSSNVAFFLLLLFQLPCSLPILQLQTIPPFFLAVLSVSRCARLACPFMRVEELFFRFSWQGALFSGGNVFLQRTTLASSVA